MSLSEMEARGELEPVASSPEELKRLLVAIRRRLKDADVEATSNEARFEHAYHAILGCALAALRANDLRATAPTGKHVLTLNTLAHTVKLPHKRLRYFQQLRNRRNIDLYEGDLPVSTTELLEAIAAARDLAAQAETYVRQLRPEIPR